jgi:hypothetical protein
MRLRCVGLVFHTAVAVAPSIIAPKFDRHKNGNGITTKKNPNWNKGDNPKLYTRFLHRKANPKETRKKYINPNRLEHFSQIPCRKWFVNFLKNRQS